MDLGNKLAAAALAIAVVSLPAAWLAVPGFSEWAKIHFLPAPKVKLPDPPPSAPKSEFPMYLEAFPPKAVTCLHRGGTICFSTDKGVLTPPSQNAPGWAQVSVPRGARFFEATLTESSGSSCDGGYAVSSIKLDGVEVAHWEQTVTQEAPVHIPIPDGKQILRMETTTKGGTIFCSDPIWYSARFMN